MDKLDYPFPIVFSELNWTANPYRDLHYKRVRVVSGVTFGGWIVTTALVPGGDGSSSFSVFVPDPGHEWNPEVLDATSVELTYKGKRESYSGEHAIHFTIEVKGGWIVAIAYFQIGTSSLSGIYVADPDEIPAGLDESIPSVSETT